MKRIIVVLFIGVFVSLLPPVSGQEIFCTDGTTRPCGSTIGPCEPGTRVCINGEWSDCQGGVTPRLETCGNGLDDNCNGELDECPQSVGLVFILIGVILIGFIVLFFIISRLT